MTFRHWRRAAVLAPAAITAVALATPAAAAASPSWQLTDQYTGRASFTTGGGSEYLELNLSGSWSVPLTFGASGLPAGGSYSDVILYENLATDTWSTGP